METPTRTELTAHETDALFRATIKVREASLPVGAFVTRYGSTDNLKEAAALFTELYDLFTQDHEIRIGALHHGYDMAIYNANRSSNQAFSLQNEFLRLVFSAAMAERNSTPN